MTISHNYIVDRLRFFGLRNSEAVQLTREIQRWIESNGPEWTVKRLKTVKQLLLCLYAGTRLVTGDCWIRKDRLGIPRGVFKCLFTGPQTFRRKVRMLNALMVYSSYISTKVTAQQWEKFHSSVSAPPVNESLSPVLPQLWQLPPWSVQRCIDITDYSFSHERRTYDGKRSVSERDISLWFAHASQNEIIRDILHSDVKVLPDTSILQRMLWSEFSRGNRATHSYSGRISLIQEPGFKLRAVANPNRLLQVILEPLKKALGEVLKGIPQDCTFDQVRPLPIIESWLREGCTVNSVDLSDATNFFPLSLTIKVLNALDAGGKRGWGSYINYFKRASLGLWSVPHQGDLVWTKGQPLGLGPSFFAFALSHHYLMVELNIKEYFILGDDVVIRRVEDAVRYRQLLDTLGCPVSESKTISSSKLAEFAGKVVTPEGVIAPIKWKQVSDVNFLDQVRNLGQGSEFLLTKDQRRAVKLVEEIPEWYGGLGWNPKGYTLAERIERNLSTIRALESTRSQPFVKEGVSGEIRKYLLTHHLTDRRGMPHESFGSARQPDRAEPDDLSLRLRVIRVTGVQEDKFETAPDGWHPSERKSDPRVIPKALYLARDKG